MLSVCVSASVLWAGGDSDPYPGQDHDVPLDVDVCFTMVVIRKSLGSFFLEDAVDSAEN